MSVELGSPVVKKLKERRRNMPEAPAVLKRQIETVDEGRFLVASGISDAVIDFRQGFLGDMGSIRNEFEPVDEGKPFSRASLVLEWVDPDDLRHLIITISAGISEHKESYLSAVLKEKQHFKKRKEEPGLLEIAVLHFDNSFSFKDKVSRQKKVLYKKWLREHVLNYKAIWGDIDS